MLSLVLGGVGGVRSTVDPHFRTRSRRGEQRASYRSIASRQQPRSSCVSRLSYGEGSPRSGGMGDDSFGSLVPDDPCPRLGFGLSPDAPAPSHDWQFSEVRKRDWRLFRKNLISRYGEGSAQEQWAEGRWAHEIGKVEPVRPGRGGSTALHGRQSRMRRCCGSPGVP